MTTPMADKAGDMRWFEGLPRHIVAVMSAQGMPVVQVRRAGLGVLTEDVVRDPELAVAWCRAQSSWCSREPACPRPTCGRLCLVEGRLVPIVSILLEAAAARGCPASFFARVFQLARAALERPPHLAPDTYVSEEAYQVWEAGVRAAAAAGRNDLVDFAATAVVRDWAFKIPPCAVGDAVRGGHGRTVVHLLGLDCSRGLLRRALAEAAHCSPHDMLPMLEREFDCDLRTLDHNEEYRA